MIKSEIPVYGNRVFPVYGNYSIPVNGKLIITIIIRTNIKRIEIST